MFISAKYTVLAPCKFAFYFYFRTCCELSVFFLTESGLARDDTDLYSDTSSVGDNSEYGTSTSSRGTRSTG